MAKVPEKEELTLTKHKKDLLAAKDKLTVQLNDLPNIEKNLLAQLNNVNGQLALIEAIEQKKIKIDN